MERKLVSEYTAAELGVMIEKTGIETVELVMAHDACPSCGERRMDWLEWNADELVQCATCGAIYDPSEG